MQNLLAAALVASLLCACGDRSPPKPVAASVNGSDITVAELRDAARRLPAGAAPRAALEGLIDEELLAQHALKHKLDRRASVVRALESARRQILAQASIHHIVASAAEEDKRALHAYYENNPLLFVQRRNYRVFEVGLQAANVDRDALRKAVRSSRALSDVTDWLRNREVPFMLGAATKFPEQVPEPYRARLAGMRDGDIQIWEVSGQISVIQLVQSQSAPLSEDDALPMIARHLLGRNRLDSVTRMLEMLRASSSIAYQMHFDDSQ
jgi:EpsD family peptidyl-prolyl cis-trans isomerase